MPGVPPDALAQVKKGLKNVFHRKGRREGEGENDAISIVSPEDSAFTPVEAPSAGTIPSKSPKLTTPIPGSHIGTEGLAPEEADDTTEPAATVPMTSKTFAEGMSATSGGPIGSTFEEAEEFERMMEKRSSTRLSSSVSAAASETVAERTSQDEAATISKEADDMLDAEARAEAGEGGGVVIPEETIQTQDAGEKSSGPEVDQAAVVEQESHEHKPGEGGETGQLSKAEQEV